MFKLNNKDVNFLVGNLRIENLSLSTFDNNVCDFLSEFSNILISDKNAKKYNDLIALAFWCRKKNLIKLKKLKQNNETRIGRGLIFHITPSNVPTNFFYSLIFGLLSGNSNIVKVPSKKFIQISIISSIIEKLLKKRKYVKLKKMITIIGYKDDNNITKLISENCDTRIVWGGDKTINNIREFSLKPHANEITFSDRYSISVINTDKITYQNNNSNLIRLIQNFYNDTMIMDQNACSSPHLIFWLGKNKKKLSELFWKNLSKKISKDYDFPDIASIDKYVKICNDVTMKNFKSAKIYDKSLHVVKLKKLNFELDTLRGKWGYFYEYNIQSLNEIIPCLNPKYQTLTYFGIQKNEIKDFINGNNPRGVDRVVPIGQSLHISLDWDGYDIIKSLSRGINII
jgi:hypothetical protein